MAIQVNGNFTIDDIDTLNIPDSDQVHIHFWLNAADPQNGAQQYVFDQSQSTRSYVRIDGTGGTLGRVFFNIKDTALSAIVNMGAGLTLQPTDGWIAYDFVLDQTRGFAKVYRNLVQVGSATPTTTNPVSHIASAASFFQRSDGALPLLNGSMFDQFYYANALPSTMVSDTGELTAEYIKNFYEFDQDRDTFRRKTSLATAGTPQLLFEQDYLNFHINNGSEGDGVPTGTPLEETDKTNVLP